MENQEIKGLFAHDRGDWKYAAVEESAGGPICLWWHLLPKLDIVDRLKQLRAEGKTFDLYYVQSYRATHKATVIDFSLEDEYPSKRAEWEKSNPEWYFDEFSGYDDGSRHASIVFLASKFVELSDAEIVDHERFVLYQNMKYNIRSGIAAFTRIMSKEEVEEKKRNESGE